jgi:outer membrane receptor for ferrienterochelin and colicins
MKILHFNALFLLSIFASTLYAAEEDESDIKNLVNLSLEQLMDIKIITASKNEESVENAPGIISVVTAKEIADFGANSLFEILERVTSVYMTGSHTYPQNLTSMRGDLSTHIDNHVLLLLNGRPVREGFAGGYNFVFYNAFPLNIIDKIEIIRGPGSVLYGTNAYTGVINILTKQETSSLTTKLMSGSLEAQGAEVSTMYKDNKLKFLSGLKTFKEKGWTFSGIGEDNKSGSKLYFEDNLGVFALGEYKDFTLNTLFVKSKENRWGASPIWTKGDNVVQDARIFMDLAYKKHYSHIWKSQYNLTFNRDLIHFDSSPNITAIPTKDLTLEMTHFLEYNKWQGVFGATAQSMSGEAMVYDQTGKFMSVNTSAYHEKWFSLYAQGRYRWTEDFKIFFGGQAIKPEGVNWNFVPRVGIIYQINKELGTKLLYSKAFRAAFQIEKRVNNIGVIVGNPNLTPEIIGTLDFQIFYHDKNYQLSATYFNSRQQDLITRIPNPNPNTTGNIYTNGGELRSNGFEFEGKYRPTSKVYLLGSLTYQTNIFNHDKTDYTMMPNWMTKAGISYEFSKGSSISIFDNFIGKAQDASVKFPNVKNVNPPADAYHLLTANLKLNVHKYLGEPLTLNAYVYNALNQKIYTPEFNRGNINTIPFRQDRGIYIGLQYIIP